MASRPRRATTGGRDELSRLLVAIRGDRLQAEAARLSGLSQSKISRAERGRFPLSVGEADRYACALGATSEQRSRLVELTEARLAEHVTGRVALVRVAPAIQERFARLEEEATLVRAWQPEIVPGILQTPEYAAAVVGFEPEPAWLAARAARRAKLAEPGRIWHQLVSGAALAWPLGSWGLMAEQLDHLVAASKLPTVRLGILDVSTPQPLAPPAAFSMFDRTVSVATDVGTSFLTDDRDVDHYERLFAELDALALYGDDARAVLARLAGEYRRNIGP